MKILLLSAEVAPFAKVGGLADVAGALPKALTKLGHEVRVVMPRYGKISTEKFNLQPHGQPFEVAGTQVQLLEGAIAPGVPVTFIEHPLFADRQEVYGGDGEADRFLLFCQAALEVPTQLGWQPDVVQCNDWHTGIVPLWMRRDPRYAKVASLYTIHNLAYQGWYKEDLAQRLAIPMPDWLPAEVLRNTNLMSLMAQGILYADAVNTVSPTYAEEMLTEEYGEHLQALLAYRHDHLFGILNGIDEEEFNPATDKRIVANFDAANPGQKAANKAALQAEAGLQVDPTKPLLGIVSRLVDQKGFDLVEAVLEDVVAAGAQWVILGTGEPKYHELLTEQHQRFPGTLGLTLGFDAVYAQHIYAGCDMFMMPSRFEPCGLGQMISLRYGTIPVVRSTGGLADTINEYSITNGNGNGFSFHEYSPAAFRDAIARAQTVYQNAAAWDALVVAAMNQDFSWAASATQYVELYEKSIALHNG